MEEFNIVIYFNDDLFFFKEDKMKESEIFFDLFFIEIIDEFFIFVSVKDDFFKEYIDLEVFNKSEIVNVQSGVNSLFCLELFCDFFFKNIYFKDEVYVLDEFFKSRFSVFKVFLLFLNVFVLEF